MSDTQLDKTRAIELLNQVLEYELGSDAALEAVRKSKFRTVPGFGTRLRGHIMLTYHDDAVTYRNIKIRDLSAQ